MSVKRYETGDTVFECKPLVQSLSHHMKTLVCEYCLLAIDGQHESKDNVKGSVGGGHECSQCKQMSYCSDRCRRRDEKIHRPLECQIYGQYYDQYLKQCFIRLILRSYLMIMNDKDFSIQAKKYLLYNGKRRQLFELKTHEEEIKSDANRIFLFDYIYYSFGYFAKEFGFVLSRQILFKLFCRLVINQFHIVNYKVNKCEITGSALYMQASILNHSCDPNAATIYNGSTLRLKAIKEIAIGDEITINYCCIESATAQRRQLLKHFFYFDCDCHKCVTNDSAIDYDLLRRSRHFLAKQWPLTDPNWERLREVCDTYRDVCLQTYGHFHPQVIAIFVFIMSLKLRDDREDEHSLKSFVCDVRQRIELIFGTNHAFYKEFNRCLQYRNGLSF